ncbi:HNH endonuclease [Vibrio phage D478]
MSLFGVGINDIPGSGRSKEYKIWMNMLKRCYCKSYQKSKPSYAGVTVCDEWLTFSNFKKWIDKQDWHGKQLDKDIVEPGNKVYRPDACCFIPQSLNSILNKCLSDRSPVGFTKHKKTGKFVAQIRMAGKNIYLGLFSSETEASKAYRIAKGAILKEEADKQSDLRVRNGLIKHSEVILSV